MIRHITCYVADCDDCRAHFDDDEAGYPIHFDTDRQALDYLTQGGWTLAEDGHLRCRRCTARHLCNRLDHLWDVWRICDCRGTIPTHADHGCGLYRICAQCGALDITTLDQLPVTGQHHRKGR